MYCKIDDKIYNLHDFSEISEITPPHNYDHKRTFYHKMRVNSRRKKVNQVRKVVDYFVLALTHLLQQGLADDKQERGNYYECKHDT